MVAEKLTVNNLDFMKLLPSQVPCEVEIPGYPKSGEGDMFKDMGTATHWEECKNITGYDFVYHDVITETGMSGSPIVRFDDEEEEPMIVGVHTRSFAKKNVNAGIKLSKKAIDWIAYACTELETWHNQQKYPTIHPVVEWSSGTVKSDKS